jgi:putative ABC transport system permease protein
MWNDLRFTFRGIRRQPGFALMVVLTLSLGIGGSIAIFSVVNAVLLRDLPYPDARQIYLMRTLTPDGAPTGNITPRDVAPFVQNEEHPLVQAASMAWSQQVNIIGADGKPYSTTRYGVTDQFFEVFGTRMALGRAFERGQNPGPLIISYATWRDLFGLDPDIIGKSVQAEGFPRPVVGVTPEDFEFPEKPGFFYLMRLGPNYENTRAYRAFIRLREGRTHGQFQSELTARARELQADPITKLPLAYVARPFLDYVVGDLGQTVTILFGATGILLLIACINVVNLLLSRVTSRAREMAVREALGANRWRVVRQLLTESVVLALIGGTIGLAIGAAGIRVLLRIAPPDLPRLDAVPLDARVVIFAIVVTILTGVLVGLVPAVRLARHSLRSLMNEEGRGVASGRAERRLLGGLVVAEIALAVVLMIGAGLLMRSYANLTAVNPGFNPDRLLTFFMYVPGRIDMSVVTTPDGRQERRPTYFPMATFFRELEARIGAVSGVQAVATTSSLPLSRTQYDGNVPFHIRGRTGGTGEDTALLAKSRSVSADFFNVMRIRLIAGRGFLPGDRPESAGVAVVNETFVRRFFPGESPLGQRLHFAENRWRPSDVGFQLSHLLVEDLEIVGVVDDVKYLALAEPAEPSIYLSSEQWIHRRRGLVVRAAIDNPASLVSAIRREIASMDRELTAEVGLYPDTLRLSLARDRLGMTLLVIFGVMAALLAAVGIYGVMSYSVTQRTGEIAVRSAMGASTPQLMRMFLAQGAVLAITGVVLGLLMAVAGRQIVASQLFGIAALDAGVFVVAPFVLLGVAALAFLVPARRATRLDPADLLRIG